MKIGDLPEKVKVKVLAGGHFVHDFQLLLYVDGLFVRTVANQRLTDRRLIQHWEIKRIYDT